MSEFKIVVDMSKFRSGVEKALESVPRRTFGALNECTNEVSGEAKDLLRKFDEASGDSLNAAKRMMGEAPEGKEKEKEGKKKRGFWK